MKFKIRNLYFYIRRKLRFNLYFYSGKTSTKYVVVFKYPYKQGFHLHLTSNNNIAYYVSSYSLALIMHLSFGQSEVTRKEANNILNGKLPDNL